MYYGTGSLAARALSYKAVRRGERKCRVLRLLRNLDHPRGTGADLASAKVFSMA